MAVTLTRSWPHDPQTAERQAAAYLPLHGNRIDRLPRPWPEAEGFPKPGTVLRELTAWFTQAGPQSMPEIPRCTAEWLSSIPVTHTVMLTGVPWLQDHREALWPSVAVANLLAMFAAVQHGQDSPFVVSAVQDAVAQWLIFQAIRTHVHAAISRVAKLRSGRPNWERDKTLRGKRNQRVNRRPYTVNGRWSAGGQEAVSTPLKGESVCV